MSALLIKEPQAIGRRGRPYGSGDLKEPTHLDYRTQLIVAGEIVYISALQYHVNKGWSKATIPPGRLPLSVHEFTRLAGQCRKLLAQLKSSQLQLDLSKPTTQPNGTTRKRRTN